MTAEVSSAVAEDHLVVLTVLQGVAETDLVRNQLPRALEGVVVKCFGRRHRHRPARA